MIFKALDDNSRNFMDLLNDNLNNIELMYLKEGLWLKYFGHSNSLCARATRAIVNHAPIGKYWLRFFPRKEFVCPYSEYSIKTKRHILYKYKRFNKYWNLRRDIIAHFILFLEFNSSLWQLWVAYIVLFCFLLRFLFFFSFSLSSCYLILSISNYVCGYYGLLLYFML